MGDNKSKKFLKIISQIESSGGKNYDHDLIKTGIHSGHRAIGKYGLMPNTVQEVLTRMRRTGVIDPDLQNITKLDPAELKHNLESNPNLEDRIAEFLANQVLNKQQDEEKAAYSWFQGHNLSPERVDSVPYQEHDYVQKYNKYKEQLGDDYE